MLGACIILLLIAGAVGLYFRHLAKLKQKHIAKQRAALLALRPPEVKIEEQIYEGTPEWHALHREANGGEERGVVVPAR